MNNQIRWIAMIMIIILSGCTTIRQDVEAGKKWRVWANKRIMKLGEACIILHGEAEKCQAHRYQVEKAVGGRRQELIIELLKETEDVEEGTETK